MIKSWSDEAWEDFEYWTKEDRRTLKRILQLLKDIDRNRGAGRARDRKRREEPPAGDQRSGGSLGGRRGQHPGRTGRGER